MSNDLFSARLNSALEKREISAADLSRKSGISESIISRYKKGLCLPKASRLNQLANALNVNPFWLIGEDEFMGADEINEQPDVEDVEPPVLRKKSGKNGTEYSADVRLIPLLGAIACGTPIFAYENIECLVPNPAQMQADFALRCRGDSMVGARIHDGDIVYIRQQPDVDDGQIAAVLVDDDATLKRVYKSRRGVTLVAENPAYPPMVYTEHDAEQVRILGLAVAFLSKVK